MSPGRNAPVDNLAKGLKLGKKSATYGIRVPNGDFILSMFANFSKTWSNLVTPILRRPSRRQVAALCHRDGQDGPEILLITSRDTGRWILPKGWPIDGIEFPESALREAWEEAGVQDGKINPVAIGQYSYRKRLDEGFETPCCVDVFSVVAEDLASDFPERNERTRRWMRPQDAAELVREPELKAILRAF